MCTSKIKNDDELALKIYFRGIHGRSQDMVKLRKPDGLEVAITHVIEEKNFVPTQMQNHFINIHLILPNPIHKNQFR